MSRATFGAPSMPPFGLPFIILGIQQLTQENTNSNKNNEIFLQVAILNYEKTSRACHVITSGVLEKKHVTFKVRNEFVICGKIFNELLFAYFILVRSCIHVPL